MNPNVPTILAKLRERMDAGYGLLSKYEVEALEELAAERAALLEALSVLIERCEHYAPAMGRNGDLDDARAAIAKARGEI